VKLADVMNHSPTRCGWADKILGTSDVTPQVVVGLKGGEDKVEMGEDRGLIGWTISLKG
jgi:hypothetical protein